MTTVNASYLIENFKLMVTQKWKYVACAAQTGAVDCSGAFTYWYKKAGSYMYHGSNTMWRKYSIKKGKISEMTLVPGMAVYKWRKDGKEPSVYKNDGLGNFYHVGLYIGDGKVVEAKGTKYGVVISDISTWTHCSTLKNTNYDVKVTSTASTANSDTYPKTGKISTAGGKLNLRQSASLTSTILDKIPNNTEVTLLSKSGRWYKVSHNDNTGYVFDTYIKV